jgi:hypothetical protein
MNEMVGKIPTIGEEEQPFAVFVQPAHMMQCLQGLWKQGVDRHAIPLITSAANVAARLVQGDDDARFSTDNFAIDGDLITFFDQGSQILDEVPIDGHTAFEDDLLRTPA